ncbi:uncharacterized protein PV06_07252 [Exophiala oligosperma]|uniref:Uncharacterized protein n=1 Tax=Exophiala oligosperma TaxID=215243 RepID=A0A0D2BW79_9EURO|nr:uncharacterized protein PV06_07252 [Exophiala oligosperma]KIW41722.1 hypothetical protein PV06_07252 [Exophiala oligosperma]
MSFPETTKERMTPKRATWRIVTTSICAVPQGSRASQDEGALPAEAAACTSDPRSRLDSWPLLESLSGCSLCRTTTLTTSSLSREWTSLNIKSLCFSFASTSWTLAFGSMLRSVFARSSELPNSHAMEAMLQGYERRPLGRLQFSQINAATRIPDSTRVV